MFCRLKTSRKCNNGPSKEIVKSTLRACGDAKVGQHENLKGRLEGFKATSRPIWPWGMVESKDLFNVEIHFKLLTI